MEKTLRRVVETALSGLSEAFASVGALAAQPARSVDHSGVIANLADGGRWSARFGTMTALSCAIAILGLLLSSPAVIIGAMLLSPLMSPIILFGFSLALLDRALVLRSLAAIALGTVLAVAQSAAIVWLSPLQAITPEILARTHPNLFDLLVAIFSGIAGAYAVSQHKGETLVGVAIATALMPPLAVVGFGVATLNWAVFAGAGGLFMTNLLAIGLTASVVARFFGFGAHNPTHATLWQALGIFAVFAVLSIPLGLSLRQIAGDAVRTAAIRSTLEAYFANTQSHIYGVTVSFPEDQPIQAEALVLVQKVIPAAETNVQKLIADRLRTPVHLTLSQVPARARQSLDEQAIEELTRKLDAVTAVRPPPLPPPSMAEIAARQMSVSLLDVSSDATTHRLVVHSGVLTPARLAALRASSETFRRKYSDWSIALRLDSDALPAVPFPRGATNLDSDTMALTDNIAWALQNAHALITDVVGYSDSSGRSAGANRRAALLRAQAVALRLRAVGIDAHARANYPAADEGRLERELGQEHFRRVEIMHPSSSVSSDAQ